MTLTNRPICSAPWTHSFVNPEGRRGLCCHSDLLESSVESQSFNGYWNSQVMKEARLELLKGNIPSKLCSACVNDSHSGERPFRHFQIPEKQWQHISSFMGKDGSLSLLPEYLDYRLGNFCNFSCRTCNSLYSSKIESQVLKQSELNYRKSGLSKNLIEEEFDHLLTEGHCKKLYFAAGEILLLPTHWEMLKRLVDKGIAQEILLNYNTNLSHQALFKKENQVILSYFKKVGLAVSLDNAGETGEFIRDGLKWNQFISNMERLRESPILNISSLDITFTLPLMLDFEPLIKYICSERLPYTIQKMTPGGYATLLSPLILDLKASKELIEQNLNVLKKYNKDGYLDTFIRFLNANINSFEKEKLDHVSLFSRDSLLQEYRKAKALDNSFKRKSLYDFYSDFPETKALVSNFEDILAVLDSPEKYSEEHYWQEIFDSLNKNRENIVLFPGTRELQSIINSKPNECTSIEVLISKPTLVSKLLSSDKTKFDIYNNLGSVNVLKETPLSVLIFLLRKRPKLLNIFAKIEPYIVSILPFFSFHSIIEVTVNSRRKI